MRLLQGCFFVIILFLARNVDGLLNYVTGLAGFCLVPESDESSDDVSNESYEDNEDEESFQYIPVPYGYVLIPLLYHYNKIRLPILPYPCLS